MELQRGTVGDQPWGLTLGALSQRAATGELTIVDGPLRIVLAVENGRLVAATSTMRAGSLLERATRTFELARGTYTLSDETTIRRDRNEAIDLRAVVFAGARKYLPDDRLTGEIRQLGSRFTLSAVGADELPHYALEVPDSVIAALREGATLSELEAHHVDGRAVRAAVYALVCCGSARGLLPARAPTPPQTSRTTTPGRTPTPPGTARTITPDTARTATAPDTPRTIAGAAEASRAPEVPRTSTANDSGQAVLARIPTINMGRNPTPPGTARTTTPGGSRTITASNSRTTTPSGGRTTTNDLESRVPTTRDRPPLFPDEPARAEPARPRPPTPATFGRTRTRATPFEPGNAGPLAADAAERARMHLAANEPKRALREATAAMHLVPDSFDYQALHAWTSFCASKDKAAAADGVRKQLEKASHRAEAPHEVRLLLGRLEREIGREREALRHFRAVLDRVPDHPAASAELRELEAKLEAFARR